MGKNTQFEEARSRRSPIKSPVLREFSSGGVVFKNVNNELLWLIAATSPSEFYPQVYFRLPKGWIDDEGPDIPGPMASGRVKAGENSLQHAALREVAEEGGVAAEIVKKIGTTNFVYHHRVRGKVLKFVTFYLMKWLENLPEGHDGETSEVLWLPYAEAKKKLSFISEKDILSRANELAMSIV
jgi:8-oxo-dGTP pyrophosphatase MutT (NUDIX family)